MPQRRSRRHLPTLDELRLAPEVAVLDTLRAALDVTVVAVTAAQPELWQTLDGRDAICTYEGEAADEVLRTARDLAAAVDAYRALVTRRLAAR